MPFVNLPSRNKRGRSSWFFFPSRKVRILARANIDGTASAQDSAKARFRQQSSRMISFLGISRDDREDDNATCQPTAASLSSEGAETSSTIVRSQSQHSRRHSSSAPGLTHRLSHKFSSTFGHPTVVHRTSLRSRPSVRSVREALEPMHLADPTSPQDISAASTYNSGSGSSPAQVSTNPTSDGLSASPNRSAGRHLPLTESSRVLTINRDLSASKLTPISEAPDIVVPSIITVEATATAKIFFETHFKHVLYGHRPRSQRRKDLEMALESCNWSPAKRHRARLVFTRQEHEFLRQDRVLKSKANALTRANHVSIAGYEVVKVLGKGSFGVVRLVKEKVQPQPHGSSVKTPEPSKGIARADLSALKSTAREVFPLLGSKRKSLTKLKKDVYAMKVIRKSDMLRNSQEGHLRAERDLLVASENSRWIVPLIAAFQDNKNLYLVMDYCVGGDFLALLIRKNTLSEEVTRWYIAEMILCVEESHSLRWIHRDVKPDNFLISASGHLKISDFGLAFDGYWSHDQAFFHNHRHSLMDKLGIEVQGDEQDKTEAEAANSRQNIGGVMAGDSSPKIPKPRPLEGPADGEPLIDWRDKNQRRKLARSVVGTSQYMAPEVIRGDPYDGRCDWWSVGIILYECLFGFTPFACENRHETKLKILKHRHTLCFPDDHHGYPPYSIEVIDLMRRLLREKEERLSSPRYYLNDYAYSPAQEPDTYHIHGPADKSSKNYQGRHVYADDADDIKAHPWFRNTNWTQIHRRKPPFVPKIKGWEDTKYFDTDEPVSDIASSSSEEDEEPTPVPAKENLLDAAGPLKQDPRVFENAVTTAAADMDHRISGHQHEPQHIIPSPQTHLHTLTHDPHHRFANPIPNHDTPPPIPIATATTSIPRPTPPPPLLLLDGGAAPPPPPPPQQPPAPPLSQCPNPGPKDKKNKEKRRPRDKILRDPVTAKIALEIRRRGAFLGYAYRRPKGVGSVLERVQDESVGVGVVERGGGERGGGVVERGGGRWRAGTTAGTTTTGTTTTAAATVDGRRDSAIAGIGVVPARRVVGQEGFGGGGDDERAEREAAAAGRRGGKTPSPRCITPVENGMAMMGVGVGVGVPGRLNAMRFGMI